MKINEIITEGAETYQPPELAVGDKILKGKFKNSPAEIKGFKQDKHNQPVLKTNKGDVQLFKPRVKKLMQTNEEELTEIDYTSGIEPLQISFEQLIASAKVVGDIDNRDVWLYDDGNSNVYFTCSEEVDGLIILVGNKLHGVRNYSGVPGLITMLIGFVTHRLKMKVIIGSDEPLTSNGIDWLCSLIRAGGRGLTIKDQTGDMPDADKIYQEWATAMKSNGSGPTEITIESLMTRKLNTKEENLLEGKLMPTTWFIGDKSIL